MIKDNDLIKKTLFIILTILTLIMIYYLFFPKKSYIETKLEEQPENNNINTDIKEYNDSNKEEIKTNNKEQEDCKYRYEKKIEPTYTEWSEFSNWQKEPVQKSELVNVEQKTVTEKINVPEYKQVEKVIDLQQKTVCEYGYTNISGKCTKEHLITKIDAETKYTCENGYNLKEFKCYNGKEYKEPIKTYSCPDKNPGLRYELENNKCKVINVFYGKSKTKYTCPDNYTLKGNKCVTTETIEVTKEIYKDVIYYRFQTRNKTEEKYDIIWSTENDTSLLEKEYTNVGKFCNITFDNFN